MSLLKRVALVTGSTSGIGLGVARSLAKQGADLVLNGFGDATEISTLASTLMSEFNIKVTYEPADLSKPEEIEKMYESIVKAHSKVDILVNNAGIQHVCPIETFPVERWNAVININLNAVYHTTRLVLPKMKEQNWGRIINVAS
jgi:3-hydroxybutyrate dehydrogenase